MQTSKISCFPSSRGEYFLILPLPIPNAFYMQLLIQDWYNSFYILLLQLKKALFLITRYHSSLIYCYVEFKRQINSRVTWASFPTCCHIFWFAFLVKPVLNRKLDLRTPKVSSKDVITLQQIIFLLCSLYSGI